MKDKFNSINLYKTRIDKINPPREWNEKFLNDLKINFTFHSNKLENNSITYGQTLKFLKEAVTPKEVPVKDCIDIRNHYDVLDSVFKIYKDEINSASIKHLHSELMRSHLQWGEDSLFSPGKFKTGFNYVVRSNGALHKYMDPDLVPDEIEKLCKEVNKRLMEHSFDNLEKHPLTTATYFHNRFLEIHPFEDGNGRVCRIIFNEILLKEGFPPIFINVPDREKYLKLFETSNSEALEPMLDFFADQLVESLKIKMEMLNAK